MSCTSTFWKCVWLENMGSITKVMNMEVKNVPWRFCPFFTFGIVRWRVGKIAAGFLPSATQEQVAAARLPSAHCHTACRNAGMLSAMLGGDRQMTSLTQLLRRPVEMARKKWRQDDVMIAQKVSRASKRNKTGQNHTSLLQELDCCRFEPKRRFWSAFQFPGTRNKWMYYSSQTFFLWVEFLYECWAVRKVEKTVQVQAHVDLYVVQASVCHFQPTHNYSVCPLKTCWPIYLLTLSSLLSCLVVRWEIDDNYCRSTVLTQPLYSLGPRLLDITDATVMDYLIGMYWRKTCWWGLFVCFSLKEKKIFY